MTTNERLAKALAAAHSAFWREIALAFPEASTGDLDPVVAVDFLRQSQSAVINWIDLNVKGSMEPKPESQRSPE